MLPAPVLPPMIIAGIVLAIAALTLRRVESKFPAPGDISPREGLGHMLVGYLAGVGLVASIVAGVILVGAVLPVATAAVLGAAGRFAKFGTKLVKFYPLKLPLAAASIVIAILLLMEILNAAEGLANV